MNKKESFEEFLDRKFAKIFNGIQDKWEEDRDRWFENLTEEEYKELANEYGNRRERQGFDKGLKLKELDFKEQNGIS